MGCIFCSIVKGEIPSEKVGETEKSMAFLDLFPLNKGHVLVISKKHYERLDEIPPDILQDMTLLSRRIALATIKAFNPDGYHILMNNGKTAGQEISHAHFHIIPRFEDDGVVFGWRHLEYADEELKSYGDRLRTASQD